MEKTLTRRSKILLALSVSLLTAVTYLPVLRNEFILWDDDLYITKNYHIHHFDWSMVKWAFSNFFHGLWQPLTSISLAVDCAIWGLNPSGYHLSNVILHAFSTFIVVIICVLLLESLAELNGAEKNSTSSSGNDRIFIVAGVTGLLFGIHPLHVESVAWATERKDVLYGFFYLLSGYFYIGYVAGQRKVHENTRWFLSKSYLCSLLFFVLSLLSKSMAVTLPVVMLVLEWYPLKRIASLKDLSRSIIEKIPFFIFAVISSLITMIAISPEQGAATLPLPLRPLIAAKATVAYLQKTIFPFDLLPYYPYPPQREITLMSPSYLLPVIITVVISGCAFLSVICTYLHRDAPGKFCGSAIRGKGWQSAWLCYIVMLFPVIGILDNGGTHSMAHRYFYLPSLGPFCILGVVAARIWEKSREQLVLRKATIAAAAFVSVSLLWITFQQIQIWRNSIVFWSYVIDKASSPVPMAYNNRGLAYKERGEFENAVLDLNRLLELFPDSFRAYNSRGSIFAAKGEHAKAIIDFNRAIDLNPKDGDAYNNLGLVLLEKKELDSAIYNFKRAIELNSNATNAYVNLGIALKSKEDPDKALDYFKQALSLNPSDINAYNNRGLLLKDKGELNLALSDFSRAISLGKDQPAGYINRGATYRDMGELDKALNDLNTAIELNSANHAAYNNRGLIWKSGGEFEKAIKDYGQAIALKPDNADAYTNRGVAYENIGRLDAAIKDYDRAIAINPGLFSTFNNRGLALRKKGLIALAVEDFDKAVSLNPSLYITRLNRAMTLKDLGRFDRALQDYNKVLALKPDLDIAYLGRGSIHEKLNRPALARGDYEKACSLGNQEGCNVLQGRKRY